MNKLAALLLVAAVGYSAYAVLMDDAPGLGLLDRQGPSIIGRAYLGKTVSAQTGRPTQEPENASANVVEAVVVDYRGFDTLGEMTALFAAVAGLGLLLRRRRRKVRTAASPVLASTSPWVLLFILVTAFYVLLHGEQSPGGAFPGGAMLAAGFVLLLVGGRPRVHPWLLKSLASLAGLSLVGVGFVGLYARGNFLASFWGSFEFFTLFAGVLIALVLSSAVEQLDADEDGVGGAA